MTRHPDHTRCVLSDTAPGPTERDTMVDGSAEVGGPLVSVVVPTKNVERTLRRCLESIRDQTYREIETIVVDNFSDDATFEIATELADVAFQAGPERSAQRNLGIDRATGEYVLWIDADMVLTPDVVRDAVTSARSVAAVGVFIPEESFGDGFWTRCRALERRCYIGQELIEAPRLVRRDFFSRSGGFVTDVAGQEDADLRMRLLKDGARLVHSTAVIEHDEGRLTFRSVMSKRFYYGQSLPAYNRAQPGAIRRQAAATVLSYARNVPILTREPRHALGLLVLRTAEAVAYGAGAWRARTRRTG